MSYSITREDGTADAMALQDALNVIKASASWDSPTAARLRELRDSIEEQVKPVVEEPQEFGSLILATNDLGERKRWFQTAADPAFLHPWLSEGDLEWRRFADLSDVKILQDAAETDPLAEWETDLLNLQYRRDTAVAVLEAMDVDQYLIDAVRDASPQSDGTGALPTSPSPEVGVATSPPVPSPIEEPQEFGSVVRASSEAYEEQNWTPIPRTGDHWWHSETGQLEKWRDLIDPEVLRIGVGAEQANLDESVAYSNGYERGADDKAAAVRARVLSLRAVAITAPEQDQLDKAIRECR